MAKVSLHAKQSVIFNDPTRYKVVAAGRRFGKSFLAAATLFAEGAKESKVRSDGTVVDLATDVVYYVGPTFKQARENLWNVCMEMGQGWGVIKSVRQNEGEILLTNDRIIRFKGADDPDSLRGVGLSYCVMDEYAFMKPLVWEYIVFPALMRPEGGALFIGTPAGKNHFYELYLRGEAEEWPDWKSWHFGSVENPHLTGNEIDAMTASLSEEARKQEIEASFEATGGKVFNQDSFKLAPSDGREEPLNGEYVVACDLAGFVSLDRHGNKDILDDSAICIAKITDNGWYVKEIEYGKWDVRETALRILKAYRKYRPFKLGIEKGTTMNAVLPYLQELQYKHQSYFEPIPLTHGNNKKEDRIKWALQGRCDQGKITLEYGEWCKKLLSQAIDFPNPLSHDDLLDALAYVDQLAEPGMGWEIDFDDSWIPLDLEAGY